MYSTVEKFHVRSFLLMKIVFVMQNAGTVPHLASTDITALLCTVSRVIYVLGSLLYRLCSLHNRRYRHSKFAVSAGGPVEYCWYIHCT